MSDLMWIAVPGGTSGVGAAGQAMLRVLITPRLDGGTLAASAMDHWPPTSLVTAKLAVDFASHVGGAITTVTIDPPHIQPQAGLWEAFFGAGTAVTAPRARAASARPVQVDDTSQKAADIVATFTTVAATGIPANQTPLLALNPVARSELQARWGGDRPPPPVAPPPPPAPPFVPPDFHRTIALLREHPAVLRALGLIVELKLPMAALPAAFRAGVVRVRWPQAPATLPSITPLWTRYSAQFLPGSAAPAGHTGNVDDGMVTLTDAPAAPPPGSTPRWDVVTVDVDNAARRLRDAAVAINAPAPAAPADATAFALPALRSGGITLVKRNRQADFTRRQQVAAAFANAPLADAEVTADDLVLGYRIDVKLQGRDWQSLNLREVEYSVARNGTRTVIAAGATEEGHIKAHAALDDGVASAPLRTDEAVARWSGWSLAVPRPDFTAPAARPLPPIHAGMPYEFRWRFSVPLASLPRLRFAHSYHLRARVADLAGGGLDVADPRADRCFTDLVTYRRYEPVPSPDLTLPAGGPALGHGEAVDRVVMRSDVDTPVGAFTNNLVRAIAPPRSSLTLVEQHGALDHMTPPQIRDLVLRQLAAAGPGAAADEVLFPDFAADGVSIQPRTEPGSPNVGKTERAWGVQWPDFKSKQIVLQERTAADDRILEWQSAAEVGDPSISDRLIVRLAKAEELTLEISSFLQSDLLNHFAVNSITLPETSADAISEGLHPMVTPARTLTLTHAVRRPLGIPGGTFNASRQPNQTFATLDPAPALLGIDANSTATLEITASWTDPGAAPVTNAPVQTVLIGRGDTALRDPIRHELGDTRHRNVTYALNATSRFRQYFDAADPAPFSVRTVLASPVSIPNSARPSPPVILSVRPAFAWEETRVDGPAFQLKRHRLPGRLRIELKGDWFETGEGECLALLLSKNGMPDDAMAPFLTRAGGDPIIMGSFNIPILFPTAAAAVGDGPAREVPLVEAPAPVVVVPFNPWLYTPTPPATPGDARWLVDIALPGLADPGTNAWPFVEMAVARYQANSLPGLELSRVVKAEMSQALPERFLNVRRSGNDLFVTYQGLHDEPNPEFAAKNLFVAVLERFQAAPGTLADAVELTALAPPGEPPVPPPTDGLPAWVAVDNQLHLARVGPQELRIPIPQGLTGPLRLRIRESEEDDGPPGLPFDDNGELTARTVYSDIIPLT